MTQASVTAGAGGHPVFARWSMGMVLPLCATAYQICAKYAAATVAGNTQGEWLGGLVESWWFAAMMLADVASFIVWMIVLGEVSLSAAFPMTALSYVLVIAASCTLFHEPLGLAQVVGSAAIVAGVYMIGRDHAGDA